MCGAQLSGRQVLGRALPSCTTNMWAPCRHTRLSHKPRYAGVTMMMIRKPSSKSRRQSIQAEALPPSGPAPVDRFYSTWPAARTPRTPVPRGDPGPPSSCLPFAFPSNTLFGHLASQHLTFRGTPQPQPYRNTRLRSAANRPSRVQASYSSLLTRHDHTAAAAWR